MRAVNLLPEDVRARQGSGARPGSGYVALGVLGALLVAVLAYVLTANQVASRQEQAADARRAADRAAARIATLGAFGEFERTAASRTASVTQLAQGRFGWHDVMREMGRVLPQDSWLTEVDASTTPAAAGGSSEATTSTPPAGSTGASSGPTARVAGCAPGQADVARMLVRLDRLPGVRDVTLGESSRGGETTGGQSAGAGTSGDCGRAYTFEVNIAFEVPKQTGGTASGQSKPVSTGEGQ